MQYCKENREVICMLGDLIEALYHEVNELPLSDSAKGALVMVTLSELVSRDGRVFYFQFPPQLMENWAAA